MFFFPSTLLVSSICAAADLGCIKDIELPRYSFLARRSPQGGTVRAIVRIGENGKAEGISTPSADENLASEVRNVLMDETSYQTSCRGKSVELLFTFRIEGEPATYPFMTYHFEPPNHFTIVSEPKKPHILLDRDLKK